jgi:molecular chaperone DnaJ
MSKDYYKILGVPRNASLESIKRAYRRIAKENHPDITQRAESREAFQEVEEAYRILRDRLGRKKYDGQLRRQDRGHRKAKSSGPSVNRRKKIVSCEKSRPAAAHHISGRDHLNSQLADSRIRFPVGVISRFVDSITQKLEDIFVELRLNADEARRGGVFPVKLSLSRICHRCRQAGNIKNFFCPECGGSGTVHYQVETLVRIPPYVKHATELTQSIGFVDDSRINLKVRILCDGGKDKWNKR